MIYQLKIQLKNVSKPPVWRRILVPSNITFHQLHLAIQAAMGWYDMHLYQFNYKAYKGLSIRIPNEDDWDFYFLDSTSTPIDSHLNSEHPKMEYTYDFGDDWIHSVVIEKTLDDTEVKGHLPVCIAAKGTCPPEDCGGPWEWEGIKYDINSGDIDEWRLKRLMFLDIDPNETDFSKVDIDEINSCLSKLKFNRPKRKPVDKDKLDKRVKLLYSLTREFMEKKGYDEEDLVMCESYIDKLAESRYNIATGRPEIWAAAFVNVITECNLYQINGKKISREEICNHFGVKQAGVLSRVTQIHNVVEEEFHNFMEHPSSQALLEYIQNGVFSHIEEGYSPEEATKIMLEKVRDLIRNSGAADRTGW